MENRWLKENIHLILEDCDIDYEEFKSKNREQQISILNSAMYRWLDGSTDKLIDDDFYAIEEFEFILNKR